MVVGIGAAGVVGMAIEAVSGVYEAPTKFFPIRTESLRWTQSTVWREVIRGVVAPIGAVPGNGNVEGDIDMELLPDVLPYFLRVARGSLVKVGLTPDFTYTFTPNAAAVPSNTASITVVRNGQVFAYTGAIVASQNYSVDDGMAVVTFSLLGREEQGAAVPASAFTDDGPFGAGSYNLQIPTATQIFDADQFSLQIEDNANVENRLRTTRGPAFISYGTRRATLSLERDFESKAEYTKFKDLTETSITLEMIRADNAARFCKFNMPVSIYDQYDVGLSGVGELIRASTSYVGVHDNTSGSDYSIEIGTDEDIVL